MKKRTLFTLLFAIILIILSGVSSIFFFQQLSVETDKNTVKKTFDYDGSDELVINIKNGTNVIISPSDDDNILLTKNKDKYNSKKEKDIDWSVKKNNNQTVITINEEKKMPTFRFSLIDLNYLFNEDLFLSLPKEYKKVSISSDNTNISTHSCKFERLNINAKGGDIGTYATIANELSIENTQGSISVNQTTVNKQLTLTSTNGDINLDQSTFSDLIVNQENGWTSLNETIGNIEITTENGDTSIYENKGSVKLTTQNGDIAYSTYQPKSDIDIKSSHGDVQIGLNQSSYEKDKIDLSTRLGDISIFDDSIDSQTSYKKNTGINTLKVSTDTGDISIYQADEDNNEYSDE